MEEMKIGFYTSNRYFELKKTAVVEATKKLGIDAELVLTDPIRPSFVGQTFGFEDMFKRMRSCAAAALTRQNVDVGIGIENSLVFIYNADEWYYVIGVAIETKDGKHTESFTSGIKVPLWMIKEIQKSNLKMDSYTQSLAGQDDPVMYFSGGALTRKDLMIPALLLAFTDLNMEKSAPPSSATMPIPRPS
jgi:non-canonical (house-cleaning) NTP pyrophosphatase